MTQRPRITIAVDDPEQRARLESLLASENVELTFQSVSSPEELLELETHAVVVTDEVVDPGEIDSLTEAAEGAPGVIVLSDGDDPLERVRLAAAGVSAVVDMEDASPYLGEELAAIAQAEALGGVDGPEAGGYEAQPKLADFQSRAESMRDFLDVVRRVAASDCSLLITGETGVGKERLARAIHAESDRREGPFVSVNCGSLPENLLESELFGHEPGAFTDAKTRRKGRFELAKGGTIFLDEIGETPAHLQVKLLTVLQRREVAPLGGEDPVAVDVRVMAATNRDLREEIDAGNFREDLFFRLNVVGLHIPSLRERSEDLPDMLGGFLRHFREIHGRDEVEGFDETALDALLDYGWPGNVREVINVVERAVLLSRARLIGLEDLPPEISRLSERGGDATPEKPADERPEQGLADSENALADLPLADARRRVVTAFERRYLYSLLARTRGAVGETARLAGVNPRTLYDKMRSYGLAKEDFR